MTAIYGSFISQVVSLSRWPYPCISLYIHLFSEEEYVHIPGVGTAGTPDGIRLPVAVYRSATPW